MRKSGGLLRWLLFVAIMTITGCASKQPAYQKAFDSQLSLTQNQCTFAQPPEKMFKIVKQVLIQQGFTIESADSKSGVIKAVRNLPDKDNSEISYNINASVDVSEVTPYETNISAAASQQTILHRATTTWWHLFWIIPIIPTGTEYQTLVIKEGNITDPGVYTDFFNNCKVGVTKYDFAVKAIAAMAAEKAAKLKADEEAKAAAEKEEAARVAAENEAKIKADAVQIAAPESEAAKIQPALPDQTDKAPADAVEANPVTSQK